MQTLRVRDVRTDGGTQPRAELNAVTLAEYAEAMADGAQFPPVIVYHDGSNYWLADGFHRYHAVLSLGLATLDAEVRQGSLQEAQWYSYSVNQSHGLRRTNEDKRRAVEAALQHPFADRCSGEQIALHCGVSAMMVSRYREAISNIVRDEPERVVTRNGSTYTMNTANIGRREVEAPEPPMTWVVAPEEDEEPEPEPQATPAVPHVAYNSGNNEWYTPAEYIAAATEVMGAIDTDPASSIDANEIVNAHTFYTAEDDGLSRPWTGRVWMNPPYAGELIGRFVSKLAHHVKNGDVAEAVVLVNNATETGWFADLVDVAAAICFPRGRVRFWTPDGRIGAPLQGQAVIYIGPHVAAFRAAFAAFGWSAAL